ncbi:MAG: hypothetical protein VW547_06270 [Alphaproteobacteria bacterium]
MAFAVRINALKLNGSAIWHGICIATGKRISDPDRTLRSTEMKRAGAVVTEVALSLLSAVFVPTAEAGLVKNFEFNVDGVLPSAEPDTTLANKSGFPEASLYSISGGLLPQLPISVNGNISYGVPNAFLSGGTLAPTRGFSLEARLRVLDIDGLGGAFFQAFDGAHRYSAFFGPGAVQVLGATGFDAFATDLTEFHTYRLETGVNTNAFDLYIDGILTHSDVAGANSLVKGFNFGDGITDPGVGADAHRDFVRFSQPIAETAVSEPDATLIFSVALIELARVRRRRLRALN